MIAKIVQGRGFRGVINYVLDKDKAQLLYSEGIRTKDKETMIQSFIAQSQMKPKTGRKIRGVGTGTGGKDGKGEAK